MSGREVQEQSEEPSVVRPRALAKFALVEGAVALAALGFVLLVVPIRSSIAIGLPGLPSGSGTIIGATFWICFGLIGSLRAGRRAGGSVLTFSTPFIVAGTVLGGPSVGALMGLISEFEPRELRLPWFGIVTNHANVVISAVAAGLSGLAIRGALDPVVGPGSGLELATVVITALVFTVFNAALVVPVLAFRTGVSLGEASRSYHLAFRPTAIAETILAWLMAVTYVVVGWWAPVACVALVVVIWRVQAQHDAIIRDPRTGLLNDLGFLPIAHEALRAANSGGRPSVLLFCDLDNLSSVNNSHGQDAGDEVIAAVARRVQAAVRATDVAARRNRAGDEFLVLYNGVASEEQALQLAWRLHDRVVEPITLRGTGVTVQIGASMGICLLGRDGIERLELALDTAEHRTHLAKQRIYSDEGRARGRTSGGVGPMDPLPATMAAFRHAR